MGKTDVQLFLSFVLEKWQQWGFLYLKPAFIRKRFLSAESLCVLGDLFRLAFVFPGLCEPTAARMLTLAWSLQLGCLWSWRRPAGGSAALGPCCQVLSGPWPPLPPHQLGFCKAYSEPDHPWGRVPPRAQGFNCVRRGELGSGAMYSSFFKKKEMEDGPGIILSELGALCSCLCTADLPFQLYLIKILNVNLKCAHSLPACLLMENKSQAGIRFMPNHFLMC